MRIDVNARQKELKDWRCPLCHGAFEDASETKWLCPRCNTTYHAECAVENRQCAVLGCGAKVSLDQEADRMREFAGRVLHWLGFRLASATVAIAAFWASWKLIEIPRRADFALWLCGMLSMVFLAVGMVASVCALPTTLQRLLAYLLSRGDD
jgi:hypothetical protein